MTARARTTKGVLRAVADSRRQWKQRYAPKSRDELRYHGTRATITLQGVDGLEGDILYVRHDLLRQYVGDRTIVWFAFGERELRPYPPSPPEWLVAAQRQGANAWRVVLTEAALEPQLTKVTNKKAAKGAASKKPAARRKS